MAEMAEDHIVIYAKSISFLIGWPIAMPEASAVTVTIRVDLFKQVY